uniref:hypothetical protein n=1 Tax=Carnobacterium TaxID=2747 RepID=UPI00344B4989
MISVVLIILTLISLPKLGDERKNLVKIKAQSSTFTVIIGYMMIEMGENIYKSVWGNGNYEGINPFVFLFVFSSFYLLSLLSFKKKYGG